MGKMGHIPFLKPNIVKAEMVMKYLHEIEENRIYSNYGPLNTLFETKICSEYFSNEGLVTTVNNATTGLMLAISESKRPKGRYALMPSFTFAATPLAAKWCGLDPYFVDICSDTWCMDVNLVDDLIRRMGDEIAVIVPYAAFGTYMDLSYYKQLHNSGLPVVVDAAASFGAMEKNVQFGKDFPGLVVYSFHATKPFGIGEGGLVYSSNSDTILRIRQAGNFGFSSNREATLLGLNSKLTEYSSAIGLGTLESFFEKKGERLAIYEWYIELLNKKGLFKDGWATQKLAGSVPHQFMSVLCPEYTTNLSVVDLLAKHRIEARTYFSPPCHQHLQFYSSDFDDLSVTNQISQKIISLPLWEGMNYETVVGIVEVIDKYSREN